ncbi:MAG: hypothetical protein KF892_02480 [Rhizobacter sp.]|nr:hypothetical protein [Rhizobacter sp.]
MKAVLGVVSLLLVLAIVAVVASRSVKTATVVSPITASAPGTSTQQQAAQIQEQVRQDVNKALEDAARRTEAADK